MSEPISSVDFRAIQLPDSGASNGSADSAYNYSSSRSSTGVTRSVSTRNTESADQQAEIIQARLQESGSNVSVGVESVNGNAVFTIRDSVTGQVIRKIPSDEAVRISQNIDRLTGLYLDRLE
jgi:flagellar protein FlaG